MCCRACKSRRSEGHPLRADHEPRRAGHGGEEAKRLSSRAGHCGQNPVTAEGLAAIKLLKKEGIPTLAPPFSASQGLLAALAGAKYVAPYVNRVDAQGGDGIRMVQELQSLLEMHAPESKVLAASFKTPRQALDCCWLACEAITLPLDVAQQMLSTPAVESAIEKFEQDWNNAFGNAESVTGSASRLRAASRSSRRNRNGSHYSITSNISRAQALMRLGDYLKPLAERWLVVGDKFVLGLRKRCCVKAWPTLAWRPKSRRLAVSVRIMKSTAYAISPATRSAPPCWDRRWQTLDTAKNGPLYECAGGDRPHHRLHRCAVARCR